ncbi:MAG: glutathione synthase, partial [Myxococcales bacterium]|nr:glutathione synthase [Myxococcales bacterium]
NRVPREDDVRSNIHAGGRVEPCEVTAAERAVVADLAPRLAEDGLVFVGLDFIGGKLTEVNVTSPTGIQELSRHVGQDMADPVIAWVERLASSRPGR